jgi:hypothetical protein
MSGGVVEKLEVLDVNTTHGALKVVFHERGDEEYEQEPAECAYAGMKNPTSGVTLALVELATGKMETWKVYETAWNEEDCTSHEVSAERLNAAKAAMHAAGLDETRKPAGEPLTDGGAIIGRPWGTVAFTTTVEKATNPDQALYKEAFGDEDNPMEGVVQATISANGNPLYKSRYGYALMMAGSATARFKELHRVGDQQVVFLEELETFSGRGGTRFGYTLTAALTIP